MTCEHNFQHVLNNVIRDLRLLGYKHFHRTKCRYRPDCPFDIICEDSYDTPIYVKCKLVSDKSISHKKLDELSCIAKSNHGSAYIAYIDKKIRYEPIHIRSSYLKHMIKKLYHV